MRGCEKESPSCLACMTGFSLFFPCVSLVAQPVGNIQTTRTLEREACKRVLSNIPFSYPRWGAVSPGNVVPMCMIEGKIGQGFRAFTRHLTRVSPARRVALTHDTPEWGEAMRRGYRGSYGFVGPPAKAGGPGSHGHRVDDAFDLLNVLPFMASQPLYIEQHGALEYLSRPRHCRRT